MPHWNRLLQYRVVVVNCVDAELIAYAKMTNAELFRLEIRTMSAIRRLDPATHSLVPHWTHLLVDEVSHPQCDALHLLRTEMQAGQASEPELLIPISVVTDGLEEKGYRMAKTPQVIICGDIHQLPAIIVSDDARNHGLDVSLMERLQRLPIYRLNQPQQPESPFITRLTYNYRSHPGILLLPSTLFYDDDLEPVADVPLCKWAGLPNPKLPMLIRGVETEDDWVEEVSCGFRPHASAC